MQEAVHAIDCLKGDVRRYLLDCNDKGIDFLCKRGEENTKLGNNPNRLRKR